ncbi:phosphate ABC transporter permease PstA [Haloferax mediterranei ATCC 33500]|uniref:Phosphate transport system permease protein PstA n=1 Tax=Haloferax mediterranei (strain ATCC 33500 / DSM 1411 / JCM 8866 / NBRC 14739 / NCIMB 2177 / R-4) TaxID=523841 RepID=I3R761_HALMT|nr:phosphate ABC transporter permease PstA [Haloferax mediterranei]AFK20071.1 phosphate ABC transporter permease [Haloferax mediterranei ATCC 33500]AHZ23447.1 phosphate ABC transporter permease [Haloferax mediterranei ATCC 33500]ELZ99618.1 phosphate ABC transporter permease [Haloferax mediterranei ATCC 33500]MDX5987178.1 phosphate ABC transporter permease PstA [Haloferax mediterranei ATCC 33500]QCQ76485.1 phosphate ABC transporter permease PstA [Haloferax mediterranei ATCC 33500]
MATDTESSYAGGFGQVSRTAGTIFRYLLLAATMFGIVTLAVLLVYVANDAIRPLTADLGWHLTFFVTLVLPTILVGGYLYRRNTAALKLGGLIVGMLAVSLLFSGGMAITFIDIIPPLTGLSYAIGLAIPAALTVVLTKYENKISFTPRVAVTGAAFFLSLFGVPGYLHSVPELVQKAPVVPTEWVILTLVLGGVVALAVSRYVARIREDTTAGLLAGVAALGLTGLAALVGPFLGIDANALVVVTTVAFVPTATYAGGAALTREQERIGLLFAATVIVGSLVGAAAVDILGFAGPQSWVNWHFLTSPHSGSAENAGLYPAIGGSILLMATVAALSFPIGVGAAVYLEEYAPDNTFTRFIDVNISNLAGVPSVVYGLLGLGVFVTYLGQSTGTVLIGGATLALLILPIVIISSREAIRAVPGDLRQASYGMGATRWQTVKNVVIPEAFPGILTGTILALGRAIGETAPLIMIGAPSVVFSLPTELSSKVSAMPLQVYAWSSLFASEDFYTKAVPAGVVVLLVVLLAMNSIAIVLRNKFESES